MQSHHDLSEPVKAYEYFLKEAFHQNTVSFFDDLVKNNHVDIVQNQQTSQQIKNKQAKIKQLSKHLGKRKGLKIFLTIIDVIAFVVSLYFLLETIAEVNLWFLFGTLGTLIIGIVFIFVIKSVKKQIKEAQNKLDELEKLKNGLLAAAYKQMGSLNEAFDWGMPNQILTKTTPLIQMDRYFDRNKFYNLKQKYGFSENKEKHISTLLIHSGSIVDNPFILQKNRVSKMVDVTYTGSIVITWTTTEGSGKNRRTVYHSQTLTASVRKPAPNYYEETWLVYGNEAAPRLSFSRNPSNANAMSEKEINRYVRKFEKEIQDKIEDNRKNITMMGNSEFEALFNATNRTNDVEFRLLFTPLAQKNLLSLIKSKTPYGDDFYFIKDKELNYVKCKHCQDDDLEANPKSFIGYDYDEVRNKFISYCDHYFTSLYFNLAPLLCIPLYQQHMPFDAIFKNNETMNTTPFEAETMANQFDDKHLKHELSGTPAILKSEFVKKNGISDVFNIHAYSYQKIERVAYISKMGGDGRFHNVPVHYYEYIPLEKVTSFALQSCQTSTQDFNKNIKNQSLVNLLTRISKNNMLTYSRGLISWLLKSKDVHYEADELNKYFLKENKED